LRIVITDLVECTFQLEFGGSEGRPDAVVDFTGNPVSYEMDFTEGSNMKAPRRGNIPLGPFLSGFLDSTFINILKERGK
jgi:hypothetical protein